jgi:hypothetical protein
MRFARLQERRVLVIELLYRELVRVEHALANALVNQSVETAQKDTDDTLQTFMHTFREHRIWLEEDLEQLLDQLEKHSSKWPWATRPIGTMILRGARNTSKRSCRTGAP